MKNTQRHFWVLITLTVSLLLVVGCSRLTSANFDRLKPGMKPDEVRAILGNPSREDASNTLGISTKSWTYKSFGKSAELTFVNDSLVNMEKSGKF
ncbi:MAG: hypothetical protein SFY92_02065 [Verrucomicrobiae bacterium]|nr:hypothetical protein [Verrucomicrobiae bacterium]